MFRFPFIAVPVMLVIAWQISAAEPPSQQPTLIAEHWRTAPGAKPAANGLRIYLVNTTPRSITVITRDLNSGLDGEGQSQTLTLGLSSEVRFRDHLLVPSLPDFSPVELRPGEAAVIRYEPRPVPGLPGRDVHDADSEVAEVRYEVQPPWGERFGVWSGTVSTKVEVRDGSGRKRQ